MGSLSSKTAVKESARHAEFIDDLKHKKLLRQAKEELGIQTSPEDDDRVRWTKRSMIEIKMAEI